MYVLIAGRSGVAAQTGANKKERINSGSGGGGKDRRESENSSGGGNKSSKRGSHKEASGRGGTK